ncbi:2'-5' RNA ligase family protein [Nocardioides dilutus]
MYLFAALVPPREILDDLWAVAGFTPDPPPREPHPPGWHRARRRRRREEATVEVAAPSPVLELSPVAHVHLPFAKFGNLALHDANRLVDALTRAAADWPSPRLRFAGYSPVESEQDPSVWVDLEGDLDAVGTVVRGVHEVAKLTRLFVDRRVFQPRVRLGGVRASATESELEQLLATLAAFETNAWWQTTFGLFTPAEQGRDRPSYRIYEEIALGPHVVH